MLYGNKGFILLVLFVLVASGLALKCYQCNSAISPECADINSNDTDSPHLKECADNHDKEEPFCRKIVTKVLEGEDMRVHRTCGWILDTPARRNDTCKNQNGDYVLRTSCACFSEACNESAQLTSVPLRMLFLVTTVRYLAT